MDPQEQKVLDLVRQGRQCFHDAATLLMTCNEHAQHVFRFCTYCLHGDEGRAKQIAQEVFVTAIRTMDKYSEEKHKRLKSWLIDLARDLCRSEERKEKRDRKREQAYTESLPRQDSLEDTVIRREIWTHMINNLNPDEREIILLSVIGLDLVEIAGIYKIKHDAARQQYSRAMRHLRKVMNDDE